MIPEASACVNCGAALAGPWCSACGQPVRRRVTLPLLASDAFQGVTSLERGFDRTVLDLLGRPGGMVRDYLAGRTVPYTPPLRFAIIAAAVAMLIAYWLDFVDPERYPLIGYELGPRMDRELTAVNEMYLRFMNLFLLFMIPVTSVLTRGLFRREALTLGEHVVFNAYAFGILTLLLTAVAAPMFLVLGGETTARVAVAMTWIGGSLIGFVVLCMRFFRGGLLRRTALAAIASLGAGIVYGILTLLALVGYAWLRTVT